MDARNRRVREFVLDVALAAPAVLILLAWLIVAVVHINDRYQVNHGQGVWMALAHHANAFGLYPQLFDGSSYGGTRYMPVPIVAHAGIARVTGEYVMSGKIVALLGTAGLLIAVFAFLRRAGCRWSWALALTGSIVAGFAGLRAGTTIGGEPLPVLAGVCALAVVTYSRSRRALLGAAVLVAIGINAKFTALWAPAAIVIWLLRADRRLAAVFAVYAALATFVLFGAFNIISGGRMLENLLATSGGGMQGTVGFLKAPARLLGYVVQGEPAVWAFVPVLAFAAGSARLRGGVGLLLLAWMIALGLLIAVYVDVGTGPNQLLDLAVLTALCVGALVAFADCDDPAEKVLLTIVAAILVWSNITAFVVRVRPPLQEAVGIAMSGREPSTYRRDILAEYMRPGMSILSADPGLLVERGQTPVVFDAFMLRRLAESHPAAVSRLVARIERREFDLVVLVEELRNTNDVWWRDYHFGTDVITAVSRAYEFGRRVGPYYLYTPRS